MEEILYKILEFVFAIIFIAFFSLAIYEAYKEFTAKTVSLKYSDWTCTKTHKQEVCIKGCYLETICDQWSKK